MISKVRSTVALQGVQVGAWRCFIQGHNALVASFNPNLWVVRFLFALEFIVQMGGGSLYNARDQYHKTVPKNELCKNYTK
jgi:hypothetical protein